MRTETMPRLVRKQLAAAAETALPKDPDFKEGFVITEAAFQRDPEKRICYWLAQVESKVGQFKVAFSSTDGIRHKAAMG